MVMDGEHQKQEWETHMGSGRRSLGNKHRNVNGDHTKLSSMHLQCKSPVIFPKKPLVLLGYRAEFIGRMLQKAESSQVHVGPGQRLPMGFQSSKIQAAVGQLWA